VLSREVLIPREADLVDLLLNGLQRLQGALLALNMFKMIVVKDQRPKIFPNRSI
jgi:hypothetical protein